MKPTIIFIGILCWSGLLAGGGEAATPVPSATPTMTRTPTPTATIVVLGRITVNHNRFNPLLSEQLELRGFGIQHERVTVRVYSQNGSLVKNLMQDEYPGTAPVVWDGRNLQDEVVASGVYLIVVQGTKLHKRFRVAVIK